MLGVDAFQITVDHIRGKSELALHKSSQPAVPATQSQPAAGAGNAVADHVHVHVDAERLWHLQRVY